MTRCFRILKNGKNSCQVLSLSPTGLHVDISTCNIIHIFLPCSESNSLENGIQIDPQTKKNIYTDDNQYAVQADSFSFNECTEGHQSSFSPHKQQSIINTVTKLTPVHYLGRGSTSEIRELIASYVDLSAEENVINSLNLLCENRISGSAGLDFLNFVGFSAFDDIHPSGCVRHPNILPVLGVVEG